MEIETQSPFNDAPHRVVTRTCGIRHCRALTPCTQHDQVVLRFCVDGVEAQEAALLSKVAFNEMERLYRDPRQLFHELAEFVLLANQQQRYPNMSNAKAAIQQGGFLDERA